MRFIALTKTRVVSLLTAALVATLGLLSSPASADNAPAVGSPAPSFRLQDQTGAWRQLEDYRGKWVVLYFYPKDNTPGCTTQA